METYIKIYSYKRIKVDEDILDVLHLEDIARAEESKGLFKILSGKYINKHINELNVNFEEDDFCCEELTLLEKNLITNFNPDNIEDFNVENYKLKAEQEYYIITKDVDKRIYPLGFCLKDTNDQRIIEAFKYGVNPSVANEMESILSNGSNSFVLGPELVDKLIGRSDSLLTQDENKFKDINDYNILEKYELLKKKIIGLDNELKVLLSNITKNVSLSYSSLSSDKVKEIKTGILILGPRGTGKTFMVESIANLFGVPSTIEDATRYTPAAYRGADIEDILIHLYINSGEKKEVFEHGIIFIDEIDKICKKRTYIEEDDKKEDINNSIVHDYSVKEETQESLLTILRGTVIQKKIRVGLTEETISLDTSKLTFVLSGAFEEIIDKEKITRKDLEEYGMHPQLADRIDLFVKTKNPTKEELKKALVEGEFSYLKLFEEYLKLYGIPLETNEEFIDYIVDKAYNLGTGYRSLRACLTEYLNEILFDLYAGKMDVVKLSKEVRNNNHENK